MSNYEQWQKEKYGNVLNENKGIIETMQPEELENGEHDGYSIFDTDFGHTEQSF